MSTVDCPSCGHASDAGAKHCAGCGARLARTETADPLRERLKRRTAGRYRIGKRLGSGGMAAVYEATDPLDRRWAIKVLSDLVLPQAGMVERFQREARVVLRLRHPHIVQLHNFEPHDDLHFLVLEFVEGRSLRDLLDEEPRVPIETVLRWFAQLASALDYAHEQGIVHRDIKPDNILIRETGDPVIADFGIAKVIGGTSGLTQQGSAIGTAYYMSPEQWSGEEVGGAADQYSLGVVLYEALGGEKPFQGDSLQTIMLAHLTEPPRDLSQLRDDVPPRLFQALARMLAKDPRERFPTAGEAAQAARAAEVREELNTRSRAASDVQNPQVSASDPVGGEEEETDRFPLVQEGNGTKELSATDVVRPDVPPEPRRPVQGAEPPPPTTDEGQGPEVPGVPAGSDPASGRREPAETRAPAMARRVRAVLGRGNSWLRSRVAAGVPRPRLEKGARRGVVLAGLGVLLLGSVLVASRWFETRGPPEVELRFVQGDTLNLVGSGEAAVVRVMGLAGSGGSMPVQISDWISENPGVARVDALGPDSARVTPVGEGATEIRAAAGDRTALLVVRVAQEGSGVGLAEIRFREGDIVELGPDTQETLVRIEGLDASGGPVPVESVSWSSDDVTVARVEATGPETGRVTRVSEGSTVVRASVGDLSASLPVQVTAGGGPPPEGIVAFQFDPPGPLRIETGEDGAVQVEALGPGGIANPSDPVQWRVGDEATAHLGATGPRSVTVEGVGVGETFLHVASGAARDSLPIIVRAEEVAAVTISPRELALLQAETGALSAAVQGTQNLALDRPVQWLSRDPAVAQVDQEGQVRAASPGATYLVASAGGRMDSVRVEVGRPVEPEDASIELRVEGGLVLVSASFTMPVRTSQTFCLEGAVQVAGGGWVPTSATPTTLSPAAPSAQADLGVSFGALDLPTRGGHERRATPRLSLWPGPCDPRPAGGPAHSLVGGEACLVRYATRDWMVESCDQ